jgi:glycosyltransferase involved in cell wall biosynthesis
VRVGVDGRSLRAGRAARGVAVYLRCLLAELAGLGQAELHVLGAGDGLPGGETLTPHASPLAGRLGFASAAVVRRPRLDRMVGGCDVAWAPAPAPLALSRTVPLVLTIHDLSFEHRPRDYTAYERLWHRAARPRDLARRAARVIAVSESVRAQLVDEWDLPQEKVVTIPSGPGLPPGPAGQPPEDLGAGYLLAVGALEPRKRIDLLVEAHARARRRGLEAELVLAGGGRMRAAAPAVRELGFVDEQQLEALYAGALALVSASREEGFGFTPLEALARGTPAVVPDLSPFREILGQAAIRFRPEDADALAEAMLSLERDPGLRERLVAAAPEPLGRLSWKRAAETTAAVLAEAA